MQGFLYLRRLACWMGLYPLNFNRSISIADLVNKCHLVRFLKLIINFSDIIVYRKKANVIYLSLRLLSSAWLKLYCQKYATPRKSTQPQWRSWLAEHDNQVQWFQHTVTRSFPSKVFFPQTTQTHMTEQDRHRLITKPELGERLSSRTPCTRVRARVSTQDVLWWVFCHRQLEVAHTCSAMVWWRPARSSCASLNMSSCMKCTSSSKDAQLSTAWNTTMTAGQQPE